MRKLLFFFLFLSALSTAQVYDDFSDGDFTNDPEWIGTTELFRIDPSDMMLQLYAPAQDGEAWLFTESTIVDNVKWQLYFRMNFNPTVNNHCRVYLTADIPDINNVQNAYYLMVGTPDKNISLWERRNGVNTRRITGISNRLNMNNVTGHIRVIRDEDDTFILESNIANGGWVEEGRYLASASIISNYFGVSCHYTQSRNRHFWFGNIEVKHNLFEIEQFIVKNRYSFRLTFSKPIENLIFGKENFTIESNGKNPDEIIIDENDAYSIELLYNDGIPINQDDVLSVKNISDDSGNVMPDTFLDFNYQPATLTDIEPESLRTILLYFSHNIDFNTVDLNTFNWKDDGPEIDNITSHATNCIKVIFVSNIPNNQTVEFYLEDLYAINGDKIDVGPYQVDIDLRDWIGTTDLFNITPSMIQLDAPAVAGEAWLFTESEAVEEAQWQLYFRMAFDPSDQNYCRIYLTADNPDINTINNAYFLVLGTTNDNICLWERRNGINRLLITGIHKRLEMGNVWGLIKVTRDENGNFLVESNILNEGWMEEGSYEGSDGMVSNYFGFSCHYTQARSRHFWFGDFEISGEPFVDTNPPEVVDFEVRNTKSFRLTFSKPIENINFDKENFIIESNSKNPDETNLVENDAYSIVLVYNDGIPINQDDVLSVKNISDDSGNVMPDTFLNFNYQPATLTNIELENLQTLLLYFNHNIDFNTVVLNTFNWKDDGPEIDNITSHATNCIKVIFVSNIPNNQTVEFYLEDLYVINGDKIDIGPYQVNINLRDWIGTTDLFNITPSMIQLDAPAVAGEAWLFTESEAVEEAQWQLYFRMYFNPSDQNYCRIYLTADNPDINTINNAYFLVLGTANDNICLWERRNGINRLLITGIHKRLDMGDVWGLIRVTRDENGNFLVESNILNEGWMEEGSYEGSDGMVSNYFGFSCRYTQLRSRHFWFGNFEISGKPYIDTNPPQVVDFEVKNMYSFRLTFSKPIEYLIFDKTNFYIESNGKNPDEINLVENDAYSIDLLYNDAIPINSSHNFFVRNITDNLGNTMQTTFFNFNYTSSSMTGADSENNRTFLLYFNRAINFNTLSPNTLKWKDGGPQIVNVVHHADDCIRMELVTDFPNAIVHELYINDLWTLSGDIVDNGPYPIFIYISKRHDIVISEIFVRTNNSVGLPDSKYIELYNRSEFPIQLADFTIRVNNNSRTLERYLLFPDDYLLIVPSNQNEQWDHVENRIAIVSGFFTSMVVGGGDLVLTDKQGNTMCVLQYNPSMGERGFKTNGGWSLEIIDLDNLSGESNNIDFSIDTIGGTPGRENSISAKNPDVYPPHLIQCYMETDNCLVMEFSETMNPQILPTDCIIEPNDIEIVSMEFEEPFLKNLKINFKQNLPENKTYNFRFVTKPEDLAGNVVSNIDILQFGIPIQPEKGDVIINELLYNPPTDGSMFVELYNRTDNLLDISQLYIARSRGSAVIPEALVQLTDKPISIFPKSYIAFTSNKNWVLHYYDIKDDQTILNISGTMPTFVNTGGSVFLTDIMGNIFERFEYNDKMHFNLLGTTKGVSLERISSEESAMNPQNWHSASADQNYATPGKINSQARSFENIPDKDFLIIEPQVFTPNHDGNDDLLFIRYIFDEPGNNLTITIFNRLGQPVRHITNNSLSGTDGFFTWDGLDDNGQRCPSGIYIVWAKSFNMNGNIKETKKSAVLSYGK